MSASGGPSASGGSQPGSEDAARIQALLKEVGIVDYDPRIVNQLMDVAYETAIEMIQASRTVALHCQKPSIDAADVRIASEFLGYSKPEGPSREQIIQIANQTNSQPLPQIRHAFGLKLPNDRFCLLQNNVQWRPDNPQNTQHRDSMVFDDTPQQQLRPEHVQNLLKRKAPVDDFD